jgi:hypothetical protein
MLLIRGVIIRVFAKRSRQSTAKKLFSSARNNADTYQLHVPHASPSLLWSKSVAPGKRTAGLSKPCHPIAAGRVTALEADSGSPLQTCGSVERRKQPFDIDGEPTVHPFPTRPAIARSRSVMA